ncbi:hypothetical protein UFOVP112_138 [uncultured Caudovirales phage]|uniref:Uncharacterized protein n=1 Tax=uncultured Caudovirales phage TaxID=2100421 RepID=A0A6J5L8G9_9CAUD|nr:hypothetical protein UFOVP112_138 [uncultured Caudovirales phage]
MAGENNIDPDLINQTNKGFEQFNRILEASTAALGASTRTGRSATEEAAKRRKAESELIAEIKKNAALYGLTSKASKAQIQQVADTIKAEKEADKIRQDIADAEKKRDQEIEAAVKKLGNEIKGLARSSLGAATAVYTSDKAFSSTIPTLDLVSGAFKAVVEATGVALSGISAFGFSLGNAPQGISKVVSAGITVATEVAKMQLEMAQKYVDTYDQLSSVGVTFGGQLTGLAKTAAEGGLNLQTFGNFVKNNVESLSTMGGGMEAAASRVIKMGKAAVEGNDKLLVMYGGFEQVDGALAGFAATLARSGLDTVKNQAAIQASSGAYLYTLKELQEVTGMSLGQVKAAQEEQAKDAAFQLKLLDLRSKGEAGIKEANALEFQQMEVTRLYGKQAGDLMKEKIALDGKVISQSGNQYQALNKGISDATDGFIRNAKLDEKVRLQANAQTVKATEDEVEANRKRTAAIAKVQTYAPGDQGKAQADALREEMAGRDARLNLEKTANDRAKKMDEETSNATKKTADLLRKQNALKQTFDQKIEDRMGKMADIATGLMKIQESLINTFGDSFTDSVDNVIVGLVNLAVELSNYNKGQKGPTAEEKEQKRQEVNKTTLERAEKESPEAAERERGRQAQEDALVKRNAARQKRREENEKKTSGKTSSAPTPTAPVVAGSPGPVAPASVPMPLSKEEETKTVDSLIKFAGGMTGNKEHFAGMDPTAKTAFLKMISDYGKPVTVTSSYRNPAEVSQMFAEWTEAGKNGQTGPTRKTPTFGNLTTPTNPASGNLDPHARGVALDLDKTDFGKLDTAGLLVKYGFKTVDGDPGHIAKLAKGGVTDGVSIAGEAGPEAVVPLPDGRTIPVKMDTGELVSKLEEMIKIMREQHDTSERILLASS